MKYTTTSFASAGSRAINEDNLVYEEKENGGLWIVADGAGNGRNGETASETVVSLLPEYLANGNLPTDREIKEAVEKLNGQVRESMGISTLVCASVVRDELKYFSVGNSRLYLFRNGSFMEHSEEIGKRKVSNQISDTVLAVTPDCQDNTSLLGISTTPECWISKSQKLAQGDSFILCSDGFWKHLNELEMELDRLKSKNDREWLNTMVKRVLMKLGPGSEKDNITVLIVTVE